MKELLIGNKIKLPFTTLRVEEAEKNGLCKGCFFEDYCERNGRVVYEIFGSCDASEREDRTNVIFKEINHE